MRHYLSLKNSYSMAPSFILKLYFFQSTISFSPQITYLEWLKNQLMHWFSLLFSLSKADTSYVLDLLLLNWKKGHISFFFFPCKKNAKCSSVEVRCHLSCTRNVYQKLPWHKWKALSSRTKIITMSFCRESISLTTSTSIHKKYFWQI